MEININALSNAFIIDKELTMSKLRSNQIEISFDVVLNGEIQLKSDAEKRKAYLVS